MFLFLSQFGHRNSSKIQTKSVYTEAEAVCTRLPICAGPRAVGVRARGAAVDAGELAARAGDVHRVDLPAALRGIAW